MKHLFSVSLFLLVFLVNGQETVKGKVVNTNNQPLLGANVFLQNTSIGASTDADGQFSIIKTEETNSLLVSYVGFKTQKVKILNSDFITIVLEEVTNLNEVTVTKTKKSKEHSLFTVTNVQKMGSKELLKAACCNLSESFSTNPSIDVNFSDAVTGNRQIKMLGLTSPYILITEENIPSVRGASQAYGLSYIPGTWVEGIQITKGAGSVINGYESISGQINYEILKPLEDVPFFVNLYTGMDGRFELNTHFNQKYSQKLSSSLFIHGNTRQIEKDMNNDVFLDNPIGKQINILNRWQYNDVEKGWVSFLNVRYIKTKNKQDKLVLLLMKINLP